MSWKVNDYNDGWVREAKWTCGSLDEQHVAESYRAETTISGALNAWSHLRTITRARIAVLMLGLVTWLGGAVFWQALDGQELRLLAMFKQGREISRAEIHQMVRRASKQHGVPQQLVLAVIKVESDFNPWARSRAGAMGLMQITRVTALHLGLTNPWDANQNIDAGTRYLRQLLKRYRGNKNLALAAYNAGPEKVFRYKGIPPYPETREYVGKVLAIYRSGGGKPEVILKL